MLLPQMGSSEARSPIEREDRFGARLLRPRQGIKRSRVTRKMMVGTKLPFRPEPTMCRSPLTDIVQSVNPWTLPSQRTQIFTGLRRGYHALVGGRFWDASTR